MAKWETGEIRKYVIDDEYTSKSTAGQQTFELHQSLTLDTTWEAKGTSPNGGVKLSVSIDRVRYMADGKGAAANIQNLGFDSKAGAEPKSKPEQGVAKVLESYVGPVGAVAIGLGEKFEAEFYFALERVKENPELFAADHTGYRPCQLKRFTAVLYFRIDEPFVVVVGLFTSGKDERDLQNRG